MKSFRGYACMCMWLCIPMLCSQLVIMNAWACDHAHFMLCRQFLTMHVCACDYAHLCYSVGLFNRLFPNGKNILFCHLFGFLLNNSYLCYEVISWLCMHVHVIMHIHAMQPSCNHECMSMWPCTFYAVQTVCDHACYSSICLNHVCDF